METFSSSLPNFVLLLTHILRLLEFVSGVFRRHVYIPSVFYDHHSALSSALFAFSFFLGPSQPAWAHLMAFCAQHVRMIHAQILQSILTEWCLMNFVFAQARHKPLAECVRGGKTVVLGKGSAGSGRRSVAECEMVAWDFLTVVCSQPRNFYHLT